MDSEEAKLFTVLIQSIKVKRAATVVLGSLQRQITVLYGPGDIYALPERRPLELALRQVIDAHGRGCVFLAAGDIVAAEGAFRQATELFRDTKHKHQEDALLDDGPMIATYVSLRRTYPRELADRARRMWAQGTLIPFRVFVDTLFVDNDDIGVGFIEID